MALSLLAFGLILLAGCSTATAPMRAQPATIQVVDVAVEPALFRVRVRWEGESPGDPEALLLERCALLTIQAGGRSFFVVNASEALGHPEWLNARAVDAPVMVVPDPASGDTTSLSALIRAFPKGREPAGYRLYDAERILRDRKGGRA